MEDIRLSEHFWLSELIHSAEAERAGIPNIPTAEEIEELRKTASTMERVRAALGNVPILVSSGLRTPPVNRLVGGSLGSDHLWGGAVDFRAPSFGSPYEVCLQLTKVFKPQEYGQIIYEGSWTHFARIRADRKWVGDVKTATFVNGRAVYTPGINKK